MGLTDNWQVAPKIYVTTDICLGFYWQMAKDLSFLQHPFMRLVNSIFPLVAMISPRVLVPKPVPTGSAYVTHAPQEPHFGSDTLPLFDARKWSKYNHTAPCLYNSNSFKAF